MYMVDVFCMHLDRKLKGGIIDGKKIGGLEKFKAYRWGWIGFLKVYMDVDIKWRYYVGIYCGHRGS